MSMQNLAQALASPSKLATLAALSAAALMGLSACEERTYPSPSAAAPPPASAPTTELMGAPDHDPAYAAPPPPAYAAPPAYSQPYASGAIVAMAPIPNPGDPGSEPYYGGLRAQHLRVHTRYEASGAVVTARARQVHPVHALQPVHTAHHALAPKTRPVYAAKTASKLAPSHKTVAATAAGAGAGPGLAVHHAGTTTTHAAVQAKPAAPYPSTGSKTTITAASTKTTTTGDTATDVANLQTTLADEIGKTAVLAVPSSPAGQPADVTLTVPPSFGDTLRSAAKTDNLSAPAASAALTATLSGDGYTVLPADQQYQSLTLGQATVFHWTVTPQPNAKGPLHADVGADLLGGGSTKLALGTVQKKAGDTEDKTTSRVIGAALLVLIGAMVVAWVSRRRGVTDPRRRVSAQGGQPLNMDSRGE